MSNAEDILNSVRDQLNDPDCVRWSDDELVRYVNQAQRQIVLMVPSANVVTAEIAIAESTHKIDLPSGGVQFLQAHSTVDGSTYLRTVSYIERDILDSFDPDWRTTEDDDGPQHYMHDPRLPKTFWVYPARNSTRPNLNLEISYSAEPAEISSAVDTMSLSAVYDQAVADYVIYRALTKEGRYSLPTATIDRLWQSFTQSLGLKHTHTRNESPFTQRPPENKQ